jgi:uncharacterized membrane protein YdcZ (DUF606 family)
MLTRIVGVILMIVGVIMMVYTGYRYVTTKRVVYLGSIGVNQDKDHYIHWSPIVGVLLFIVGVIVIVSSKKERK